MVVKIYVSMLCLFKSIVDGGSTVKVIFFLLLIISLFALSPNNLRMARSPKKDWRYKDSNPGPLGHELTMLTTKQSQQLFGFSKYDRAN